MNSTEAFVLNPDFSHGIEWAGGDIIQILFLVIIAVFGTLGNILLVITIWRDRKLKIPGNYFIINLAIADLIITAFSIPVILSNFIRYRSKMEDEIEASGFCQSTAYLKVLGLHVSWYSLAFIALNRYFSLCRMKDYATYYTKKKVLATIGLIWVFVILINFPIMAGWAVPRDKVVSENSTEGYYYSYHKGRPPVLYDKSSHDCVLGVSNHGGYTYANGFFVMSVPLISIIFCYSLVSMEIVRSRRRLKMNLAVKQLQKRYKRERKISVMLAVVVIVFIACWAPVIIYDYAHRIDNDKNLDVSRLVFSWLALSNSAMNPGLYAMLSKAFRSGYKKLIMIIISKIVCWKLSTRPSLQDASSASNSRNESGTFSRRVTKLIRRSNTRDKDLKDNTMNQTQSMAVTGRETDLSVLDVKSINTDEATSTNLTVITAHIDPNTRTFSPILKDSTSKSSNATAEENQLSDDDGNPNLRSEQTWVQSERSQLKNVVSSLPLPGVGTVDSAYKPAVKPFTSLLDLMDDSGSAYTEAGIYVGGCVLKTDESGATGGKED